MTTSTGALLPARGLDAGPLALDPREREREARRFLRALGLAGTYGLALGAHSGVFTMAAHAVGVPLGFVTVALIGAPAFYVALAHAGVDTSALALTGSLVRGIGAAGLVLAGLSPTMLLLTVSCESSSMLAIYGVLGLAAGGCLGLRTMFAELAQHHQAPGMRARLPRVAFALFAVVFCSRVWWSTLSVLGGGQ
jgi:hypothetical protein